MRNELDDGRPDVIHRIMRWGAWLGLLAPGVSGEEVGFGQAHYTVPQGGQIEVQVEIEPLPEGNLASYGVRLVTSAGVTVDSVEVPAELNYTGFKPGATEDLSPGVMGVKGNTQFSGGEFQGYTGSLLATFTLKGVEAGVVNLGLDLFRTAGSREAVFVTTDKTVLDETMTFGSATLTVAAAPELEITRLDAGRVRVRYEMSSGMRYFLRRSEDLVDWEVVAETVGGAAQVISLEFLTSTADRGFFRLEAVSDGP